MMERELGASSTMMLSRDRTWASVCMRKASVISSPGSGAAGAGMAGRGWSAGRGCVGAGQQLLHAHADIAHGRVAHRGPGGDGGVLDELEKLRAFGDEGAVAFDVVGEGRCADDEDHVMAREPVHDALAHGGQKPPNSAWSSGKPQRPLMGAT
jgi:hypothetical protein